VREPRRGGGELRIARERLVADHATERCELVVGRDVDRDPLIDTRARVRLVRRVRSVAVALWARVVAVHRPFEDLLAEDRQEVLGLRELDLLSFAVRSRWRSAMLTASAP